MLIKCLVQYGILNSKDFCCHNCGKGLTLFAQRKEVLGYSTLSYKSNMI